MSNDLIKPESSISPATIQQRGNNNLLVVPNPNSTVNLNVENLNVTRPQDSYQLNARNVMAVQSFNKDYYQLLVTCDDSIFEDNIITISNDRILTSSYDDQDIVKRCNTLNKEAINELKTYPAIICQESEYDHGKAGPAQMAIYGYLNKIRKNYKNVQISFVPLYLFPQHLLTDTKKNAFTFDLHIDCAISSLNRCAWTIHEANLFEALEEIGLSNFPKPM